MATTTLAAWLRREPKPAKLRLPGGQMMAVPLKGGRGSRGLLELVETLEAMAPEKVEALAEDGTILRVRAWEQEEGDEAAASKASGSADLLKVIPELARIINEAADRGAQRHASAYDLAFTKQNELVTMIASRLHALETAWVKTLNQSASDRIRHAEQMAEVAGAGGSDPLDAMIAQVVGSRMAGGEVSPEAIAAAMQAVQAQQAQQAAAAAKKQTNGHAKPGKKPS